jgi:glycolate oxidase
VHRSLYPARVDAQTLRRLAAAVAPGALLTAAEDVRPYECDGLTGHRAVPAAVALPASTEEVAGLVRVCHAGGVPYVARGAGTGLSGGALPVAGGLVISLARMTRVLAVDVQNARVVVQPGVTNAAVTLAVAEHGLYYAPDPSSQQVCSIGGNVAENSGGAHCLKHGFTVHHVVAATFVCADGRVARLGSAVCDAPGYDLLGAVVGSEGTLGIVTEVTLRVLRRPESVRMLLAAFSSVEEAASAVSAIVAAGMLPAAVEMMDRMTREASEQAVHAGYPDCEALLLVEVDGPLVECSAQVSQCRAICESCGATEIRVAADDAERALMWKGRKAAFAAMGRVSPAYYVQDGVVPRTKLPGVLHEIGELASSYGMRVGNVFHAGDGNLHPLVCYDASIDGEADRALELAGRILDVCIAAGGSITGEHGVGQDKACSMPKMFSASALTVMDRLRAAFDPRGLCNPGKLLPTPRLCGEVPGFHRVHPLEAAGLAQRW